MNNNSNNKILLLNFKKEFINTAYKTVGETLLTNPESECYSIIAINENSDTSSIKNMKTNYLLCSNSTVLNGKIEYKNLISCGMSDKNTFGLSSTDSKRSMFSVNKPFSFKNQLILPFEEPFTPYNNLSLYENIVLHGIERLSEKNDRFIY